MLGIKMFWKKQKLNPSISEILPINGPSKFSFKFADLPEISLLDWPPSDAKLFGWDEAKKEIRRHWDFLSSIPIWSPYPILSYCLGSADAPSLVWDSIKEDEISRKIFEMYEERKNIVHVRYFLFPLKNPKYQNQAVAQVICETKPKSEPGDFTAWVDALREEELQPENIRDINTALKNKL